MANKPARWRALLSFIANLPSLLTRSKRAPSSASQVEAPVAPPVAAAKAAAPAVAVKKNRPKTKPKAQLPAKPPAETKTPACPHCKKPMLLKVARTGQNAGGHFWGCSGYPQCRGIRACLAPMKV